VSALRARGSVLCVPSVGCRHSRLDSAAAIRLGSTFGGAQRWNVLALREIRAKSKVAERRRLNPPEPMKITVELSPEHAKFIAEYAKLTGYTQEEFASFFMSEYLRMFEEGHDEGSFLQETIGAMYFKDRESAKRVQAWLLERVSKRYPLNSIKTRIKTNPDGTFGVSMVVPCTWNESGWLTIA
jgi:hypothetical protein